VAEDKKSNIVLVSGNQYDVDNYLNRVKEKLNCEQVCRIYSDSCESNHIIEEVMGSDIFGSRTLFIIRDLPSKDYNNIISIFDSVPEENYVVFYTYKSFAKYKKFIKGVADSCGKDAIVKLPEKVKNINVLIKNLVEVREKEISNSAVDKLASVMGDNTGLLTNEIDKLINYVGESTRIEEGDVDEVCWINEEYVIWDLLNYLSAKNISMAMKVLSKAFKNGTECEGMLFMLTRSLRLAILIKDCHSSKKMSLKETKDKIKKVKKKEGAIAYSDYEIDKMVSNSKSFCNNFTLDQLLRSFFSVSQGFLKIRSVYDSEEKEREMSLILYAICYPDNVMRVYDKEVEYVQ
jgi:DNA polymerase III delta subunit